MERIDPPPRQESQAAQGPRALARHIALARLVVQLAGAKLCDLGTRALGRGGGRTAIGGTGDRLDRELMAKDPVLQKQMLGKLSAFLVRPDDRALFGLRSAGE